ncbi:MAG: hypothetical protein ACK47M_03455 [Caldilinea sp.]
MEPKPRKGAAPSSILQRLPNLKLKMVSGADLYEIYHYFLDHFGENDEFMQMGVQTSSPMIEEILTQIARSIFKENVRPPQRSRIIRIPERGFLHGSCIYKGRMASFFYFEDIDSGMAAFLSLQSPDRTEMARFSIRTPGKRATVENN